MVEVPALDPARDTVAKVDPAQQTALISELIAELAGDGRRPVQGGEITVMRDRVIWMPSVIPFQPSVP
jgi:hypothetical protein